MRKENQSYCGYIFSEGEQNSSSFSTTDTQQQEVPNFAIQWKFHRDYSSNIIIDLKFYTSYLQSPAQSAMIQGENELNMNNENLSSSFFAELNSFQCLLSDRSVKKIDRININLKQESMNTLDQNISRINEFLKELQCQFKLESDIQMSINADFNWNGIDIDYFAQNAVTLQVHDIYSYFPLSNFKYPNLKKIVITPDSTAAAASLQKSQIDMKTIKEFEKDFEQFLCSTILKQLDSIYIDGNKYPSLIRILVSHLLKIPQYNLKTLELSMNLDPRQFHLILSLSHLYSINKQCQILFNYTLDFALLFMKQSNQSENILVNANEDDEKLQSLSAFPYLFTQIMNCFGNKNINLIFKNLKSIQQLELFDRLRSHSDQILKNDSNIYLKYFKLDKNFISECQQNKKQLSNEDASIPITSLIYAKYNKLPPFSNQPFTFNNQTYPQKDAHFDDSINQFKFDLNKPFLSLFIKTFVSKPSSEKLHDMIETSLEIKKKSVEKELHSCCNLSAKEDQPIFQFCSSSEDIQQNGGINDHGQKNAQIKPFPFQPFSLFKSKQEPLQIKKLQSEQPQFQKTKQIIQPNLEQNENIFSTYFLPFQTNEVTSIELVFENTVFGSNYKELFLFISKCHHLKKLCLLNFCLQDDFGNQSSESSFNNQRHKADTQQALRVYSSVFQTQPRKAIEKVIPDLIQSLRKINLLTFKFSTNVFCSFQSTQRLLQTQENLVYFSLRDFSPSAQLSSNDSIPENISPDKLPSCKLVPFQKQLSEKLTQTINLNTHLLQFNFKNSDLNCIQSKREFQQIISFYHHLKKTLLYQIYASKHLLHSDIIKRKEIFNYLITKFYIQTINIQQHLNKTMSQVYI